MRLGRWVVFACAVVVACAPEADDPSARHVTPTPAAGSLEEASCVGSTNVVDNAVCPRLGAVGCASAPAAPTPELCRRLHLDLTGVAPTTEQIATSCAGKTPREIATALMATPAYVKHAQELWGEIFGYDPTTVDGAWLADSDGLVAKLVRGETRYDAFATRMLGHPVFGVGARMPRSDVLQDSDRFFPQVARRALKVFLGRDPIADEDVALAKLYRPWRKDILVLNNCYGRAEPVLDPSMCPCESTVFGTPTRIVLPLSGKTAYGEIGSDTRAELDKIGALFVSQEAFWTQGADLALAMLLGWWKTTRDLDASMLPEIQHALADELRAGRSWKDVVLEIVTSVLYIRSNRAAADLPVFCMGPLRLMRPEAYIASLGNLLRLRVGRCDHRTYEPRGNLYYDGSEASYFPDALREDEDSDIVAFGRTDYAWFAGTSMGGCSAGVARSEDPSLPFVFGAAPVAATICSASEEIMPPDADRLAMRLLGRTLSDAERAAIAEDTRSCSGCDARKRAAQMCAAMARSTDAMTY